MADVLHFRRAAELIGTAQPTLSQQMLALERDLGVRLFDRTKRTVHLTNAGSIFLTDVREILERIEGATEHVREAEAGQRGTLRVGASNPAMSGLVSSIARTFARSYPKIGLRLRLMHTNELIAELQQRRIDVAFGRSGIRAERVATERLWAYPYHIMLPVDHAEAKKGAVHLGRLKNETLITYPRSLIGESYDELFAFCNSHGFVPGNVEEVATVDSILGLIGCGVGVAILPSTRALEIPEVVSRPIAASRHWTFGIAAYWRAGESSPLLRLLLDVARQLRKRRELLNKNSNQ